VIKLYIRVSTSWNVTAEYILVKVSNFKVGIIVVIDLSFNNIKNRSSIKLYNRGLDKTHFTTVYELRIIYSHISRRYLFSIRAILSSWIYFIFVTKYYHPNDMPSTRFILKNEQYYRYDILWWLMNHVSMFHYLNWTCGIYFLYTLCIYGIYCDQTYNYIAGTAYNNILDECI